jgi:hypothetical protein
MSCSGETMRLCFSNLCLLFFLSNSFSAHAQTTVSSSPSLSPTTFQQQAQAAGSGGKSFSVINLTATAEWTAGSDRESGNAQLQANADGSTSIQLTLGKASRTEVQTKADSLRTCTWVDGAGTSHDIVGPNCLVALPWFAPGIFAQPSAGPPALLATTDDGVVTNNNSTVHQVSYFLNLTGRNAAATKRIVSQSTVKVFYDPQALLPLSLEYSIHPDNNALKDIPVRVVFSNYQSVSGVMLPFQIERYVNRTLQVKLNVSNATIE